jgi:hypothetical protein
VTREPNFSVVEIWQSDHRADIEAVQEYQLEHPNVVSSLRLDNDPPMSIRVLTWRDEGGQHATAIRRLCEYPNDLVFEAARHSPADLATILDEVRVMASNETPRAIQQSGLGWDVAMFHLRADLESLAATLFERFGDAIELTVGIFPYPPNRPLSQMERVNADRPMFPAPDAIDVPGLEAHFMQPLLQIVIGVSESVMVALSNEGDARIEMSMGAATVALVDPSSGVTVGGFYGAVAASARIVKLDPGQRVEIDALVGTTSFQRDLGYFMPPGRYVARARIPVLMGSRSESVHVMLRALDAEALVVER